MSEWQDKLNKLQDKWEEAKGQTGYNVQHVPAGLYEAKITIAEICVGQNSGKLQCHWKFVITRGEFEGSDEHAYAQLENPVGLAMFQQDLTNLKLDIPENILNIQDTLDALIESNPIVRIQVKKTIARSGQYEGQEFTNIIIRNLLDCDPVAPKTAPSKVEKTQSVVPSTPPIEQPAEVVEDDNIKANDEVMDTNNNYLGTVVSIRGKIATVKNENGERSKYALNNLLKYKTKDITDVGDFIPGSKILVMLNETQTVVTVVRDHNTFVSVILPDGTPATIKEDDILEIVE